MIIISSCCINAFAKEAENSEYQRLGILVDYFTNHKSELGAYSPYDEACLWKEVDSAKAVYQNNNSSEEEYREESDRLLFELHNMPILSSYARAVVGKANKIKNVNNYYNKSDWSAFQRNIALLQSSIGTASDEALYYDIPKRREITQAFHNLLNSYNRMTLQSFVVGDADGNGTLNVQDATTIQRYLANMTDLSTAQLMRASVDLNNSITIEDVTKLQRHLADFDEKLESPYAYIGSFETGETEDYLYERLFNYTLCPETISGGLGLKKVFFDTVYYQDIFKYCSERGLVI